MPLTLIQQGLGSVRTLESRRRGQAKNCKGLLGCHHPRQFVLWASTGNGASPGNQSVAMGQHWAHRAGSPGALVLLELGQRCNYKPAHRGILTVAAWPATLRATTFQVISACKVLPGPTPSPFGQSAAQDLLLHAWPPCQRQCPSGTSTWRLTYTQATPVAFPMRTLTSSRWPCRLVTIWGSHQTTRI